MVTLTADIPDKLGNSFLAIAKKRNIAAQKLLAMAVQKLVEDEKITIEAFATDEEMREFSHAAALRTLSRMDKEELE